MSEQFGTATLSDALDKLGIAGQCFGIRPVAPEMRIAGRARTIRMVPVGHTKGTVGDYIDDIEPGELVVIDNDGQLEATVWGDILTLVAHNTKIAGTVIDGVCRDSWRARELNYPIFSRGTYMRTGKDRVRVDAYDVTVSIGGIAVEPGDLLIGDADGIVSIPRQREAEVLALAASIEEAEERIRAAVEQGSRLDEARRQFGYHQLQSGTQTESEGN
jgi:4-hydroxy-4-methyl-2-oxoglutarate aldolase